MSYDFVMTMATASSNVIELTELVNADFLTCKICLDIYKDPKILPCFHSFCAHCLNEIVTNAEAAADERNAPSLLCPECHYTVELGSQAVNGLMSNSFMQSLLNVFLSKDQRGARKCESCEESQSVSKCLECNQYLCDFCEKAHKKMKILKDHHVLSLEKLQQARTEEVFVHTSIKCKAHHEPLQLYCTKCEDVICIMCKAEDHVDHYCTHLKIAAERYGKTITQQLNLVEDLVPGIKAELMVIDKESWKNKQQQEQLQVSLEKRKQRFTDYVDEMFSKQKSILDSICDTRQTELTISKRELEFQLISVQNAIVFNRSLVQHGQAAEIVIAKKQLVQHTREVFGNIQRYGIKERMNLAFDASSEIDIDKMFDMVSFERLPTHEEDGLSHVYSSLPLVDEHMLNFGGDPDEDYQVLKSTLYKQPDKKQVDRWSPLNPEGKMKYDRRFLFKLQYSKHSVVRPAYLSKVPDIDISGDRYGSASNMSPENTACVVGDLVCNQANKPEKDDLELFRAVRSILKDFTYDQTKWRPILRDLPIDNEIRLNGVINIIFEKAMQRSSSKTLCAQFCKSLMSINKVPLRKKPHEFVGFHKRLVMKCQVKFERDIGGGEPSKLNSIDDIETLEEQVSKEAMTKRKTVGFIRFIYELFNFKILTKSLMHGFLNKLLEVQDDESLECFCALLTSIGKEIDKPNAKSEVDQYFHTMDTIINSKKKSKSSPYIVSMIQDVTELRKNDWVPYGSCNPNTIKELHDMTTNKPRRRSNQH